MHAPTQRKGGTPATLQRNKSDEATLASTSEKAMIEVEKSALAKAVTFLNSDTIRWMNKRHAHKGNSMAAHVLPSRALQLREIFKNLDYDHSGSIDINEMREAVQYVSALESTNGPMSDPIFKDPKKLVEFFTSMDINNDGTVDFNEFLIAMTSDSNSDISRNKTLRLQNAFYEFAMKHRRQKILDSIKYQGGANSLDGSVSNLHTTKPSSSDLQRYEELKHLFSLQYFRIEDVDLSLHDELNRVKQEALSQQKELFTPEYKARKKLEISRARAASMKIQSDRRQYRAVAAPSSGSGVSLLEQEENIFATRMRTVEQEVREAFAEYPLAPATSTHVPSMASMSKAPTSGQIRKLAQAQIVDIQSEKFRKAHLPPIVPPVSRKASLQSNKR